MKSTNFPTKKSRKRKTYLEVHFGMWCMGLGVLKEPFFIIPFKRWVIFFLIKNEKGRSIGDPFKRWVIFFLIKNEKGRSIGRCHCHAKKNGGLEMGFKNGFVAKMVKNTKI